MNVLVYDVAAESGGAASILEYYYAIHAKEKQNQYYYILSTYHLENTDNITVINEPMVKRSWAHRLYFDYLGSKKILKRFQIDQVLSLQNLRLPAFKGSQIIYVHNALPFSEYRFGLFEDPKMWVYQNIIGRLMYRSIKRADKVIVQTEWMKEAIINKCRIIDKVEVSFPKVNIPDGIRYNKEKCKCFFYPANESKFKNHKVIIEASRILIDSGYSDFEIIFTLTGDENDNISAIRHQAEEHRIKVNWVGILPRDEVFKWYAKSILIFPSYIETLGLPIYEAMQIGAPIIVTNCKYAQSISKGYFKKLSFDYNNANQLANIMMSLCQESKSLNNYT